jgi:hypothetical protein
MDSASFALHTAMTKNNVLRAVNRRFEFQKRNQLFIACTTNRFPSSRCASAIQIVRHSESIAETQPQLLKRKNVSTSLMRLE